MFRWQRLAIFVTVSFLFSAGVAHSQVDEDAARALARQADCTKCHSIDKEKDGPSYQDVAAKHKGEADAVDKLYTHLTTGPTIEVDGFKEEHPVLKASDADIRNLIGWILSR